MSSNLTHQTTGSHPPAQTGVALRGREMMARNKKAERRASQLLTRIMGTAKQYAEDHAYLDYDSMGDLVSDLECLVEEAHKIEASMIETKAPA
jgi:hypothetical protein